MSDIDNEIERFMAGFHRRNPAQPEFYQSVREVVETVLPFMRTDPRYKNKAILERLTEPNRILIFRVCWEDDAGRVRVNRGFRIQFNNAIGPYKGGLRFDKTVNLSILKFLAFEQTFKNALTTLPMGGAKWGANFNPLDKSDSEIMRFCQSFMTELYRYIGHHIDIPAGDMGCGPREISYLYGQYIRMTNEFTGTMTGKGLSFGGSPIRTEATGYGCVYFAREMLAQCQDHIKGKVCVVSGAGNVATYTMEKLIEMGAKVVAFSDISGFIYDPEGVDEEKLRYLMELRDTHKTIEGYAGKFNCKFFEGKKPWGIPCDLAFPCATENEIFEEDARALVKNNCQLVCEGANMPTTYDATRVFQNAGVLFAPGKAANAGGVAISGLEMTQNAMHMAWPREEIDARLQEIMKNIHDQCVFYGQDDNDQVNYVKGANIAGFIKVAEAMMAYGIV